MKRITGFCATAVSQNAPVQLSVRVPRVVDGTRRGIATGGHYGVPKPFNEPNFDYVKGSPERHKLVTALKELRSKLPVQVPARGGLASSEPQTNAQLVSMAMPSEHGRVFAQYADASDRDVSTAIQSALSAKSAWQEQRFLHCETIPETCIVAGWRLEDPV